MFFSIFLKTLANPLTFPFNTGAERLLLAWPYLRCTALVQCAGHVEKTAMIYEPLVLLLCLFFCSGNSNKKKGMMELSSAIVLVKIVKNEQHKKCCTVYRACHVTFQYNIKVHIF